VIAVIIGILIIILSIISILVDIKRIKAVKENTKVYKELEKTVISMKTDIDRHVESQKKNSISIDKLTDEVIKKIAVKSIRDINKLITNERKGVNWIWVNQQKIKLK